jgi:hypothetical protein
MLNLEMLTSKRLNKLIETAKPICMNIPRSKRHCSLVVCKNEIVSVGTNQFKTHPRAKAIGYRYDEMHSELDALLKSPERKNLYLYNFRFNRFGEMRIARPCDLCMPWCLAVFDRVYYTTPEGIERIK